MTSLFFIVLVLYVLTFVILKKKERTLEDNLLSLQSERAKNIEMTEKALKSEEKLKISNDSLKQVLKVFDLVEENLKPLKSNSSLFKYEKKYKRFTLAFDVNFKTSRNGINRYDLENFNKTRNKIRNVGYELQKVIRQLSEKKNQSKDLKDVSYLLIISGYASHLKIGNEQSDYALSYSRAFNLWKYWKNIGIDFETKQYKELIDLQISGNGWGGVGRNEYDERKNQRFIIQIVPKIGDTENSEEKSP
ncbi:hypothetical protein [uncultured Kordia sp.]|uniref:hypothetical protein n=1 Tax=uncultured Kordia sp. TaxID=507699 RepID=UPI0026240718|nr:hypothetical protein [uncultured Kordia sp.]